MPAPTKIAVILAGILATLSIVIGAPNQSLAGAWVPEPGRGYHKLAFNYFRATDFFGSESDVVEFENTNLSYYGEIGLLPRLAAFGTIALTGLEQTTPTSKTDFSGVGDVDLGLRYNLVSDPFILSTSVLFKAPYLYDEDQDLPPGNGQEDLEFRLLFGKGLNRWGYFGFESAYRIRFEEPSDEVRFLIEYGTSLNEHLYVRTKLDIIESVKNGKAIDQGIGNPALNPEFDLGRIELTMGWNLGLAQKPRRRGRWGAEITYIRDLYGDQTLQGDAVQVGLTFSH